MRLLDRYILRELFTMLALCLCGLVLVFIAFDLISSLNRFQEAHLVFRDVVELYLIKIPKILVFVLPVTLLIALLSALTNHARHHELTAMRAAGVSLGRICAPYLAVGFLLSLVVFALNEYMVPDSESQQLQIMNRRRDVPVGDAAVQVNLFFHNIRDARTWVIGEYNLNTSVMINPRVEWRDQGANWRLIARRAERIKGVWTFFGAATFSTSDISNLESLAAKLKHPATNDAVSQYLNTQLSPQTLAALTYYTKGTNSELQHRLVDEFNRIERQGALYDTQRFAGVKLSPETTNLIALDPDGTELVLLNHALLIDAYSQEISRNSLYTVNMWKGDASTSFQMRQLADTNIIAMPQFLETPGAFSSDSKFNNRFTRLSADSAEFPISEIREYLKLHPGLPEKYQAWLNTQLQGRFATPWQCFVAVLIAIPFGAASGRRNVFVGVASAIVICFFYFILLRLGLALGTGGILPPVVAAWLPNAAFGIAGFVMMLRVR